MPVKKLKEFLDKNNIKYVAMVHSPAYTAQEIAALVHIPGKEMAKTVMIKIDSEIAMPPFGNLYNMKVFVAESLAENKEIAFNAGSHSELIKLDYKDFERLVEPTVLKFSVQS